MTPAEHLDVTDELAGVMRDAIAMGERVVTQAEAERIMRWLLVTEQAARRAAVCVAFTEMVADGLPDARHVVAAARRALGEPVTRAAP